MPSNLINVHTYIHVFICSHASLKTQRMRALRRNRQRLVMPQSRQLTELASLLKSHISAEQKGNMVLFLTWLAEGKGEGVVCAQTLEIPAQFLALPPIPHVTLSRSLNLFALHFPSAKFGERSPPRCLRWQLGGRHCSCSVRQKTPGLGCVGGTIKKTVQSDLGISTAVRMCCLLW